MLAAMAIPTKKATTSNDDEDALARLKRDYLPQWALLAYGSAVGRKAPGEVPYADYMRGSCSNGPEDGEDPDPWVCNVIEAAIEEITPMVPLARAALSVRYLNTRGPSVYRSGRVEQVAPGMLEDIADDAERRLVPVARRRGIPL